MHAGGFISDAVAETFDRELRVLFRKGPENHALKLLAGGIFDVEGGDFIKLRAQFLRGQIQQQALHAHHRPHVLHAAAIAHLAHFPGNVLPIDLLVLFLAGLFLRLA